MRTPGSGRRDNLGRRRRSAGSASESSSRARRRRRPVRKMRGEMYGRTAGRCRGEDGLCGLKVSRTTTGTVDVDSRQTMQNRRHCCVLRTWNAPIGPAQSEPPPVSLIHISTVMSCVVDERFVKIQRLLRTHNKVWRPRPATPGSADRLACSRLTPTCVRPDDTSSVRDAHHRTHRAAAHTESVTESVTESIDAVPMGWRGMRGGRRRSRTSDWVKSRAPSDDRRPCTATHEFNEFLYKLYI